MVKRDEDALICDLAETYNIYDWRKYRVSFIAKLACGLGPNSRIYLKLTGAKVAPETLILAGIYDRLSLLVWAQTKDATKGKNRPAMLVDQLANKKKDNELHGFDSPEDFENYIKKFRR